jgi:NADPH-dependent 2,4-dienoyl-CoA reductase/sulfur reductase-like enzyme
VGARPREYGVAFHGGCWVTSHRAGRLEVIPKPNLAADEVITVPGLDGPMLDGIAHDFEGFVLADEHGRVRDVFAAGDAVSSPLI